MGRGRPELSVRNEAVARGFLDAQLRVSVLARQFSMSEAAVTQVLKRKLKPAFRGISFTVNPTLYQLQLKVARDLGAKHAKALLADHYLTSGQSAEAYLLQEAGVRSKLFELLVSGDDGAIVGLREKVGIAPRAAGLALQRLQKKEELYVQSRRLEAAMKGLSLRGADLPGAKAPVVRTHVREAAPLSTQPSLKRKARSRHAAATSKATKRKRRAIGKPAASSGWSIFGDSPDSTSSSVGWLHVIVAIFVVYLGGVGFIWMMNQTAFPLLQLLAAVIFLVFVFVWILAAAL